MRRSPRNHEGPSNKPMNEQKDSPTAAKTKPANLCKKCGCPRDTSPGFVDTQTDLCHSCSEANNSPPQESASEQSSNNSQAAQSLSSQQLSETLRESFQQRESTPSSTQQDAQIVEPIPGLQSQSQPRLVPLTIGGPPQPYVNPLDLLEEPRTPSPATMAPYKMTPACDDCKRAKIRCLHRKVLDENGNDTKLDTLGLSTPKRHRETSESESESETEPQPEPSASTPKRPVRIRIKPVGKDAKSSQPAEPAKSKRPQKKKSRISLRVSKSNTASNKGAEDKGSAEPGRGTRTRKSKAKDDAEDPEDSGEDESPKETGKGKMRLRSAGDMDDNLHGSMKLSVHSVFARNLNDQIEECEEKFAEAMKSFQRVRETVDKWVGTWGKATDK